MKYSTARAIKGTIAFVLAVALFFYGMHLLAEISQNYDYLCSLQKIPPCTPIRAQITLLIVYVILASFGILTTYMFFYHGEHTVEERRRENQSDYETDRLRREQLRKRP